MLILLAIYSESNTQIWRTTNIIEQKRETLIFKTH